MTRAIKFQSGKYSVLRYSVRDWYLAKSRRDVLEKKGKRKKGRKKKKEKEEKIEPKEEKLSRKKE